MKQSFYNIFIPDKNKVLCFNSFSNSYVIISPQAYMSLQNEGIESLAKSHSKTFEALVNSGFIIDESIDQLDIIRNENKKERLSPGIDYLMVYPTQNCNLKCWYCYETHVLNSKMSEEVLENTKSYITKLCQNSTNRILRLTFFGGEPFLYYKDIVYPLLVHAKQECIENNKNFIPFFVTNASLINEKIVNELTPFNPVFQITLDGGEKLHNSVRIWKSSNKGTYQHIIKIILLLAEKINKGEGNNGNIITIRINYNDETLDDIIDIIRDLDGIDKNKIFFQLERVWQTIGKANIDQKRKLKEALLYIASKGYNVGHGLFGFKRVACPAEINSYAIINWDGNIYKCNGRTLKKEDKEGTLLLNGTIKWKKEEQLRRNVATFENETCLKCRMLPQCIGPCSQKIIENKDKPIGNICSLQFADMDIKEYLQINFEIEMMKKHSIGHSFK